MQTNYCQFLILSIISRNLTELTIKYKTHAAIKKINEVYASEQIAQNIIDYYQRFIDHLSQTNTIFDKEDYKLENELRKMSLEAEKEELLRLYKTKDIDKELFKEIRGELDLKLRTY